MAVYEALLLNTVVPQIQAAQAGDSYVMVVNATTDALRITQTGTGNALVVEDSANPDATPFVVSAAGDVGVGTNAPSYKLDVLSSSYVVGRFLRNGTTTASGGVQVGNNSQVFTIYGDSTGLSVENTTANTTPLILNTSGNLGLGVTPSTGWVAGSKAMQLSSVTAISQSVNGYANITNNAYESATDTYKYLISSYQAALYQQASGQHKWYTAGTGTAGATISFTQAMTLDASGNLGIVTTSPSSFDAAARTLVVGTTSGSNGITIAAGSTGASTINFADGTTGGAQYTGYIDYQHNGDYMRFGTNGGTERARITSGGEFLVGTTVTGLTGGGVRLKNGGGNLGEIALSNNSGSADYVARFLWGSSAALVGNITVDATSTAYNTSSDYRLKDNPQPLTNSGAFIDALKPKTWDWKSDGSKGVGFIAHEVQEVSPKTVHGVKDAVDEDGNPVYQAMEYGSAEFIANIIAELQSLRARVAQLEAK